MIGLELARLLLSFLFWGTGLTLGDSVAAWTVACGVWRHSLAWLKDSKENVLKAQV